MFNDTDTWLIYKFTDPNGRSYIGQTKNFKNRQRYHKTQKKNTDFSIAIQKIGYSNFTINILAEGLTVDAANDLEVQYIKEYNTLVPTGYNIRSGGLNSSCGEKTKLKISEALKGRPKSLEHVRKNSESHKGLRATPESNKKRSKALKGRPAPIGRGKNISNAKKGVPLTNEHKLALSVVKLGKPWTEARRNAYNSKLSK